MKDNEFNKATNKELIKILLFEKNNYNYASIQKIKKIIAERDISEQKIQKIKNQKLKKYPNIIKEFDKASNKDLIEILLFEKNNYSYVSIQKIKKIIAERDISEQKIQKIKKNLKQQKSIEDLKKKNSDIYFGF